MTVMTNDNLLKKAFKSYLVVNILIYLAGTLGVLVDGMVIGQLLDQSSVSAYGLAGSIATLYSAIAGVFSTGSGAMIANHIGRGNGEGIKQNFTMTVFVCSIISIIATMICFFGAETLAGLLGASGELVPLTADYIKGLSIGMIPTMMIEVFMRYNRLDNRASLSFLSVIAMTTINIALDIVFANIFHMGLWGMGLATSVSYWVAMAISGSHFIRKDSIFKLTSIKGCVAEIIGILTTGLPSALNRACVTFRKIILNWVLISFAGSIAVSAFSVQNTVSQFLTAITMGMGLTTMDMAGIFFGEKNENALEKTLRVSIKTGLLISIAVSVVLIIFAEPVVKLFLTADVEATAMAVTALRWYGVSIPFSLICVTLIYFYQSTKNLLMANIICVMHGFAFVVLVSLVLSPMIGVTGVWMSFAIAEILTILGVIVVVKIRTGKWAKKVSDITFISEDFTPNPERVLDLTIDNDMGKVMELSRRITEFCEKFTTDKAKIGKLSLCIEEMAGNIVQHGFKDNKKHFIDIRIVIEEKDMIFRIRDNGVKFNPLKYADEIPAIEKGLDDEYMQAIMENMGIRMIREISKEMDYKYAVNMNNLTVVL